MELVIVESPTKAKTITKFLPSKKYRILSTLGHLRDLPESKIGIDIDQSFKPLYQISKDREKVVNEMKKYAKKSDHIILATDSDREGEAIAYHCSVIVGLVKESWPTPNKSVDKKLKRIIFHEITKEAILDSLKAPRKIDFDLVDAQQTRRILDRLVGYKLSPLLWSKMGKRWLSAGRVQTVALRFIVEREREIQKFQTENYYKVDGFFINKGSKLEAKLLSRDGKLLETKKTLKLFDGNYTYTVGMIKKDDVESIKKDLDHDTYHIESIDERISPRSPRPPFTTSTMQQQASRLLGYSSRFTMRLAQNLYEKGLITYHRTDSTNLADKFLRSCAVYIKDKYGEKYLPTSPRRYKTKSRLAQEAHEAIRPTTFKPKLDLKSGLTNAHQNLYDLIFKTAVASQMQDARIKQIHIKILSGKKYLFTCQFEQVLFDGFMVLENKKNDVKLNLNLQKGDVLELEKLDFEETQTQPPPRYNEASLIKTLEKRGIGRPSTYSPTISTIQTKNYVEKKDNRFFPTHLGVTVCEYLIAEFKELFAIDFTAKMEDDLDDIARGKENLVDLLSTFWGSFEKELEVAKGKKGYINVEEKIEEKCPQCKSNLVLRYSRHGKFIGCSNYPKCKFTKSFTVKVDRKCPECGSQIIQRFTKKRRKFYGCSAYPKCKFAVWKLSQIDETSPQSPKK